MAMSVWNHNLWDYFNFIEVRLLWTACVPFLAGFLDYVKYTVLNRVYIVNATVTHQVPPLFSSRVPLYLYLCIVKRKEKSNEIVPFCSLVNKLQYNQGLEHKKTFLIMLKCKMFWFSIFFCPHRRRTILFIYLFRISLRTFELWLFSHLLSQ